MYEESGKFNLGYCRAMLIKTIWSSPGYCIVLKSFEVNDIPLFGQIFVRNHEGGNFCFSFFCFSVIQFFIGGPNKLEIFWFFGNIFLDEKYMQCVRVTGMLAVN